MLPILKNKKNEMYIIYVLKVKLQFVTLKFTNENLLPKYESKKYLTKIFLGYEYKCFTYKFLNILR